MDIIGDCSENMRAENLLCHHTLDFLNVTVTVTNTGLLKNDCRGFTLVLQMQPHVISFLGVTSRIGFMFLLFPQVSRN